MADEDRGGGQEGGPRQGGPGQERPRPAAIYSVLVGLVFIAIIAVASINALRTEDSGVIGASDEGDLPLAQFAVPSARSELDGDANIAQDDCETSRIPCPESDRRTPACEVDVEGAIRVCDLFDRPLVLSFWFTRGGECEAEQDSFEQAHTVTWATECHFLLGRIQGDTMTVRAIGEIEMPDQVPADITRIDPHGRPHVGPIEIVRI